MEEYMVGNVFVYADGGELTIFNDKFSVNFQNTLDKPLGDVNVSMLNNYINEFYQIYAEHVIEESNCSDEFKNDDVFKAIVVDDLKQYNEIYDFDELVRWYKERVDLIEIRTNN